MRTIEAMQRQLLGLIGRAVVKSISAATKCQTVDVSLIAGEPKAGVEHLEPYGFTARANSGAEAVVLFPDGDRSGTVAKLAMRQPFVLFKGLTFQKLCLPGAFRPGDHHNKMLRPGLCVVHASPQYL